MRVILLGPPGAGKGTQAGRLAARFSVPHIATGDMFRTALANGTPMGLEAKKYMDRGNLVPDDVVVGMVEERFRNPDVKKGWVLDGFPRTSVQARAFDHLLDERGESIDRALSIEVPDGAIVERIVGRRVCKKCGETFHIQYKPPLKEGVCDRCGGPLHQRTDDSEGTVRDRLRNYHRETKPLIDFYRDGHNLTAVSGEGSMEEVSDRLVSVLTK